MLEVVSNLSELNMEQLKFLYKESIDKHAMSIYGDLHENMRILNAEQDFYGDVMSFFNVKGAKYALWVAEGRYVSAMRIEPCDGGYLITSFETIPDARGKGYGRRLMCAVLEHITQNRNLPIFSHVDESNIPSLKVHLSCGFYSLYKPAVFVDGSVRKDHVTYVFEG